VFCPPSVSPNWQVNTVGVIGYHRKRALSAEYVMTGRLGGSRPFEWMLLLVSAALGAEVWGYLLGLVGSDGLGFGEGVGAEVAEGLGPFVT